VGVVYPPGVSGSRSRGETDWTLMLTLRPWKEEGGSLVRSALHVRHVVKHETLLALQQTFGAYSLVRVRVQMGEAAAVVPGDSLRAASDADLAAEALRLQVPVLKSIAPFGQLKYERSLDWWSGRTSWNGREVAVCLDPGNGEEFDSTVDAARTLFAQQADWRPRIETFVVGKLLGLKNDSWLDDDEEPLAAADFCGRLSLESITVRPDGRFSFLYDDGDLFAGHCIEVHGSLREGPIRAGIAG
jgi:hypothetical protein